MIAPIEGFPEPAQPPKEFDPQLLDPHGVHTQGFTFPGYEGLPFRGPVPQLKQDDPRQPQMGFQAFVEKLDLSNPEHMTRYQQISQMVANEYGKISYEERKWIEEKQDWLVLIRYMIAYAYMPRG